MHCISNLEADGLQQQETTPKMKMTASSPSLSPDLGQIEQIWDVVERSIHMDAQPTNPLQLSCNMSKNV